MGAASSAQWIVVAFTAGGSLGALLGVVFIMGRRYESIITRLDQVDHQLRVIRRALINYGLHVNDTDAFHPGRLPG